jgi:hypothetical protein
MSVLLALRVAVTSCGLLEWQVDRLMETRVEAWLAQKQAVWTMRSEARRKVWALTNARTHVTPGNYILKYLTSQKGTL